jgi:hypothetical protein
MCHHFKSRKKQKNCWLIAQCQRYQYPSTVWRKHNGKILLFVSIFYWKGNKKSSKRRHKNNMTSNRKSRKHFSAFSRALFFEKKGKKSIHEKCLREKIFRITFYLNFRENFLLFGGKFLTCFCFVYAVDSLKS